MILIIYCVGTLWSNVLPRKDLLEKKWGDSIAQSRFKKTLITITHFINPGPFGLKEHAVAAITASSTSNGVASILVFTTQEIFYPDNPVTTTTVILSTLSIGLFGYGLAGFLRPVAVYPSLMVYWSNLPQVSMFQSLHWNRVTQSGPLRAFWIAFSGMGLYEIIPAYIMPWLNSVSVPCLASMKATSTNTQAILTNLFGGAESNEGLGLFSLSFDWQYIQSFQTSLPLIQQANSWIGLFFCYIIFIAVYYGNAWSAKDFPFLSTQLYAANGSNYDSTAVFVDGVLDKETLQVVGLPNVTGTYAWASLAGNLAVSAARLRIIL